MKRDRWMLAIALGTGLLIRCLFIDSRSIQYDDAFSILLSGRTLNAIITGTAADTMPPLYYFLLHFWMAAGRSLAWLRFLSVLFSMASLVVLYLLVARISSPRAGGWAALFAAISPLQIYHAQDIRMYALLALTELSYLYFFVRIEQDGAGRRSWLNWTMLVISGAAAMYTHNLAVFVLIAPVFILFIKKEWSLLLRFTAALVLIGLAALPWLLLVPGQVQKIQQAFWTPRPGLAEIINALILFTATLPLPGTWLIVALVLCLWVVAMLGLETWKRRSVPEGEPLLLGLTLIPPVLLFIVSYLMRPVFVPRGFLVSALLFTGWAGIVIARSWSSKAGMVLAGALILSAAVSLPYQQTYRDFPRSPFQEAAAYLHEESVTAENDGSAPLVLHDNKLSYFPCVFFDPAVHQAFLPDEPGSPNDTLAPATQTALDIYPAGDLETAVRTEKDVYFVVFQETIQEYRTAGEKEHPALAWLSGHFQQVDVKSFRDLSVYHFLR